jgi:hypothetical protein
MAENYERLRAMSEEELIQAHDRQAQNMATGLDWYLAELHRRDESAKTRTMVRLTWVIAALTLVSTAAVVLALAGVVG